MPRRPFDPTVEQRKTVRAMASLGVPHDDIAKVIGCDPKTLRKWFRHELDTASIEATAKVANALFQQAVKGNIAAAIFWLKVRGGWSDKQQVEVTGRDGGPIAHVTAQIPNDLSGLSVDELTKLYRTAVDPEAGT